MATITLTGNTNYDCIIGKTVSATVDVLTLASGTLTIDSDSRYCNSNVGAATANTGSLDTVIINSSGSNVVIDGTKIKLIPYSGGSGTPPALHTAIAISAISYSAGIVTATTAAHDLTVGTVYRARVSGITGSLILNGYTGLYDIIIASSTTFKYSIPADPGTGTITNGRFTRYFQISKSLGNSLNIISASTSGGGIPYVATLGITGHNLSVGDWVVISGMTPAGYNGTFSVMATTTNSIDIWLGATATVGTVFGTCTKYVRASFQSIWTSFTALPNPTGTNGAATIGARGFIKVKDVQGGNFPSGALVWEGGTSPAATAIGNEINGWIEVAGAETGNMTIPRLGNLNVTGEWFYPVLIPNVSTSITNSTTTATLTTSIAHNITVGSIITVVDAVPSAYNGTFEVLTVPTSTTLTYTMLSNPGGNASVQGNFYTQICTSGNSNQTIQLPAPLTNTYYSGIFIETAKGSNTYEYYPATGLPAGTGSASVGTESARGKVVWMSTQGLIRIGHDGTNVNGYVPVSGCKIRVGNILLVNTLKAATTGAAANAIPNTTLATRYDFTASGGTVSIDKCVMSWYPLFASPYSVSMTNFSVSDSMQISECVTPLTISDGGVGCTDATRTNIALVLSLCFAGGNFTNTKFSRNTSAAAVNTATITDCFDFNFTNTVFQTWPFRGNASGGRITFLRLNNSNFTNTTTIGNCVSLQTCSNINLTSNVYIDVAGGTTTSTVGTFAFQSTANSINVLFDGLTFGGISNVHPYLAIFNLLAATQNVKMRNIGSAASPLSMGSANQCGSLCQTGANSGVSNVEFKRIYFSDQRAGTAMVATATFDNSMNKVVFDNVWTGANTGAGFASLNTLMRGVGNTAVLTAGNAAQYGTHFADFFTSSTVGKISILCNEKTISEPSASSYTIDNLGQYSGFDSLGSFIMINLNDQITWNLPLIKGHLSFPTTIPVVATGTLTTNIDLFYDIGQGVSGAFTGTYQNLLYQRPGGGGANGSTNVTMTSTTGVNINDYIYGTNIGVGAKVQSITNDTTIVSTVANAGVVSGTLQFSALPNQSITDANAGFRLKVRAKTSIAATTTKLTNIAIATVCNSTSQAYQYDLDSINLTITGLVTNSDIVILDAGTSSERINIDSNASTSYIYNYSTLGNIDIGIFKSGYVPLYIRNYALTSNDASIPVSQVIDRNYA